MNDIITFPGLGGLTLNPPRFVSVFGFHIYIYGIIIACGFLLAILYALRRSEDFSVERDSVLDLFILAVLCGLVGARLYYMLFNFSDYFGPGKLGNILKIREGGLAVYGGIIATVIGVVIYSRVKKVSLSALLDLGGFGLFIGQSIGRWGNFFNREAFGSKTELPWRMGIGTGIGVNYVHPAFLYESLWNCAGFVLLHLYSKKLRNKSGECFLLYVAWYGLGRFWIEGLRADSLYLPGGVLRVSQIVAGISFIIAILAFIYIRTRPNKNITEEE